MTPQTQDYEDEISLIDVLAFLGRYRASLLWVPAVVSLVALLLAYLFLAPSYQASATIQVGQVNGRPIEGGFVLEQRLKDPSFVSSVIAQHAALFSRRGGPAAGQAALEHSLSVKKSKDTDLVEFTLTASSRELATQKALAILDTLRLAHGPMFKARVDSIRAQIDTVKAQIDGLRQNQLALHQGRQAASLSPYNAVVDALVGNDQAAQYRALIDKKLNLEAGLDPANTFNTKFLGGVYVPYEPSSPNLPLVGLLSYMLGLLGVLMTALVREHLKGAH